MDEKGQKYLKWGIVGIITILAGIFVAPVVATAAWNLAKAGGALIGLIAFVFAVPTLSEYFAHGLYKAKEFLWKTDPVPKLWRDLHSFGGEIEEINENINQVGTEEYEFEGQIKSNRDILGPERVLEWNDRLSEIRESKSFLIDQRDELRILYKEMERDVRINEVEWKLGNAYNKAANAVNKATGIAGGTQGGRVAMSSIQHKLSEGRARLNTLRTGKSAAEIREIMKQRAGSTAPVTIDAPAREVKARISLTNNPSPVLSGLTVGNRTPVEARQTPTQDKVQSLIDRL